jgi:hypothetical protein
MVRWSRLRVRASRASQRPSGAATRLAITRWVWIWGSWARLVCWRIAAAISPAASTVQISPLTR